MADTKVKDFNEYLLENVKATREETRDFKNDITKGMDGLEKRMDRIENRMDKIEEKLDTTRQELNTRMDKLDARMDKLDEKIDKLSEKLDTSMKEIRELVTSSQKDIHALERYNGFLTSALVSAFVTTILCVLLHGKGL